ncbi:MAG: M1 family metallopeptidase [Flavobacteriales bacterium]|nr:M1 family metallopeptidase [Flavobacteriales bacterium]
MPGSGTSMRPILLLCAFSLALSLPAQRYDDQHPPNTYRNADNPYYWKNRPPYEGYWQQDVHYLIKARMDDELDAIDGELTLYYNNNSPDTLRYVFFHLYQEAYVNGSHLAEKMAAEGEDMRRYKNMAYAGTRIKSLTSESDTLRTEQDNTVLKVWLNEPLPPGERTVFRISFSTHWANGLPRRMKLFNSWGSKHYDGVHWYPRIAVYDRKFGWDTQQHLGSEFYGDFGTFDVELDFPHQYVLDATGVLQNAEEVMPADLRARLDITNFKDKPWNEAPSVITPPEPGKRKVWKFHSENTHDFAFTADPTYRIGEAEWNGVKCIALVQEPHASKWQNAAEYCAKVIKAHSTSFGMYAYPKMIVADARDGMEYPMLTLDSGNEPNYRGLFVHEIGHNWFFGMVGSNETYRAFMDEGFTQFLTAWGLEQIDGDTMVVEEPTTSYERRYTKPELARESEVYYGYQRDAVRDRLPPINTHSDEFDYWSAKGFGGYGHVYSKTAVMLFNLQYTLGDELFLAAMQHYFDQWKICHPYPEDFRQSMIDFTKVDLNWFFDQWIETDKRIDYAVGKVTGKRDDAGQTIEIKRKGSLQMPIDLRVTGNDGNIHDFHIPNTWFEKKTNATVLPRWIGLGELQRTYIAKVDIPTGIAQVDIDPTNRLADANKLNDHMALPVEVTFDHHIRNYPDRRTYEAFVRPDLWWNGYDGVKAGFHVNGSYMKYKHRFSLSAWLNTGLGQYLPPNTKNTPADSIPGNANTGFDPISFNFTYANGTEKLLKGSSVFAQARMLDGLNRFSAGFQYSLPNGRTDAQVEALYFWRKDSTDLTYLINPQEWELNALNASINTSVRHRYDYAMGRGDLLFETRSSAPGSAAGYGWLRLKAVNTTNAAGLEFRTRVFAQYGSGSTPRESALYLAGASPEDLMENKYTRSVGMVPYDWSGFGADVNHFQQGGGLGLRGYAGYLAPELTSDDDLIYTYLGNTGASMSGEIDLDGLVPFRPGKLARVLHLDAYLFGDVGVMGYRTRRSGSTTLTIADPRADAGAGFALTIKRWGPLTDLKPLTIRFDMPLLLSALPAGETDYFAFRYVVAIGRSF